MSKQVNNIARMPWDIREIVCRMSFDGATNHAIDRAVKEECAARGIDYRKVHGSSLLAYRAGSEYSRYCDGKREWEARMAPRRWAAGMMHDGSGPQSLADLAEYEILEQLHDLAAGGLLETGKDVATVARAITSLQRTQLARRTEETDARIQAIEAEHAAEIAELSATIAELRERLQVATGSHDVDAGQVASQLDELLGVNRPE